MYPDDEEHHGRKLGLSSRGLGLVNEIIGNWNGVTVCTHTSTHAAESALHERDVSRTMLRDAACRCWADADDDDVG